MKSLKIFSIVSALFLASCGGTADNIKEGMPAPDFTLSDAYNNTFSLSSFRSKSPVVLYFYPKASTPGCTKQACGVRDNISKFKENGIEIFGISVDPKEKIKVFIDTYGLNFPLLSDEKKEVSKTYGVLNALGFDSRVTFIIDKSGNIAKVIRDVDVEKHAEQVYEFALKLK
ncbi:MAG: peroxiredoxin [Ignavibacteriaceae bacterium]|nr:peroxiredoxin [Ignavibacteriaceae bacterium]